MRILKKSVNKEAKAVDSMGENSVVAWKILDEKRKYFNKVSSQSALEDNIFNFFLFADNISLNYEFVIFDSIFTSLLAIVFLNIDPHNIPIFNMCCDVELPSSEEFVKGTLVKVESTSCLEKYEDVGSALEEAIEEAEPNMIEKCRWGESRYGNCYVDPSAVYEYLRSTMFKEFKRKVSDISAKALHDSVINTLNINPIVAHVLWEISDYVARAALYDPWWDYGWWDMSLWADERSPFTTYEGVETDAEFKYVYDVVGVSLWDIGLWDYSYWTNDVDGENGDGSTHVFEKIYDASMKIADLIYFENRSRIYTMPLIIANYQNAYERMSWFSNKRVDQFGASKAWIYKIREKVGRAISSVYQDIPPPVFRMYESAAMTLVSRLSRIGGWGYESYRAMSRDELRAQWIDEWVGKGLDRNILERIYDYISSDISVFGSSRLREKMIQIIKSGGFP